MNQTSRTGLIAFVLFFSFLFGSLQSQNTNNTSADQEQNNRQSNSKNAAGDRRITDKSIQDLHKRLNKRFKIYQEGKKEKVTELKLDRGQKNRIGVRTRSIYEEKAEFGLDGNGISAYIFTYEETDMRNLITNRRTIINEDTSNTDLGDLEIIYEYGPTEKRYKLRDVKTDRRRIRFLRTYRAYLNKVLRVIDTGIKIRRDNYEREVDAALNLGEDR